MKEVQADNREKKADKKHAQSFASRTRTRERERKRKTRKWRRERESLSRSLWQRHVVYADGEDTSWRTEAKVIRHTSACNKS